MSEQGLVSIIVPVYNIENYLSRCLESIAVQTYQNLEIILVDDGSTDNSSILCDKFVEKDSRTKVIHQENSGLWAARNTGQKAANGEFIMFIDGDDYLHKDMVRIMCDALQDSQYEMALASYKKTKRLDEDVTSERAYNSVEISQKELLVDLLSGGAFGGAVWNKMYRKSLIKDIYAKNYPRGQDVDFNLRVFMKVNCAVWIQSELYYWVQRPGSLTKTPDYLSLALSCRVNSMYNNYINLPESCMQYSGMILKWLYKKMVFLKHGRWRCEQYINLCNQYEKDTFWDYWKNWDIPFYEKVGVTILLHSHHLTHWLMKVTKNY